MQVTFLSPMLVIVFYSSAFLGTASITQVQVLHIRLGQERPLRTNETRGTQKKYQKYHVVVLSEFICGTFFKLKGKNCHKYVISQNLAELYIIRRKLNYGGYRKHVKLASIMMVMIHGIPLLGHGQSISGNYGMTMRIFFFFFFPKTF